MPPNTIPISLPTTRGSDAVDFLEAHGYMARKPAIRSSAYEEARNCEFSFYLKERLGIQPLTKLNEPLLFGSWFHTGMECLLLGYDDIATKTLVTSRTLESSLELKEACRSIPNGLLDGAIAGVNRIRDRALICQQEAWATQPLPPQYDVIDAEPLLTLEGASLKMRIKSPIVVRLDGLLYNKDTNTIWILDVKTTKGSTAARIETCPFEFQTWLYRLVVVSLMRSGALFEAYPRIPKNALFGGMMHYVARRPEIRVKQTDLKKGEAYAEAQYQLRVRNWYRGEGEFLHHKSDFASNPPVLVSMVSWPASHHPLDDAEFYFKLTYIDDLCVKPAVPEFFPRASSYIRSFSNFDRDFRTGLSVYAPFYADNSIPLWPQIIQRGFRIKWRDLPKP